jgi:hypothetical protein
VFLVLAVVILAVGGAGPAAGGDQPDDPVACGLFLLAHGVGLLFAAQLLHSRNLLWGGILIFLLTGPGAAASGALAKVSPARVIALTAGALVTFAAIETSTPWVLFLGTAIAGLGFGPGFLGAYRATATVPPVTPGQRAGLITAIYIVSYVATAGPAVIGGGDPSPDAAWRRSSVICPQRRPRSISRPDT